MDEMVESWDVFFVWFATIASLIACRAAASKAVGDQALVLVFGNLSNAIVLGDNL